MSVARFVVAALSGETGALVKEYQKRMQIASVDAMKDVAELAKVGGRKSIAAGGFSNRWQNTLRSKVYPNNDKPLSPAALVYHKIQYSGIFETGGRVAGKPMLWLPLPQVPAGRGSHPLTPRQYVERIGPLRSISRAGRGPMLAGRGSRATITKATATVVRVRKRAVKSGSILGDWVPLFVGVPAVVDPQRFNVRREVQQAADKLGARYAAHITSEG